MAGKKTGKKSTAPKKPGNGGGGVGRYGQLIESKTSRSMHGTFVKQTYELSKKSYIENPSLEPRYYTTKARVAITRIDALIPKCKAKGEVQVVKMLQEARRKLGVVIRTEDYMTRQRNLGQAVKLLNDARDKSSVITSKIYPERGPERRA